MLQYLIVPPCAVATLSFFAMLSFDRVYRMQMPITRIFRVLGYAASFTCIPAILLTLLEDSAPLWAVVAIASFSWLTFVPYVLCIREAASITTKRAIWVMFLSFMITVLVVLVMSSAFHRMG